MKTLILLLALQNPLCERPSLEPQVGDRVLVHGGNWQGLITTDIKGTIMVIEGDLIIIRRDVPAKELRTRRLGDSYFGGGNIHTPAIDPLCDTGPGGDGGVIATGKDGIILLNRKNER